jgi:Zn ribbon nucleic-acid-binding protein/very-short-patch-repair endonuclease
MRKKKTNEQFKKEVFDLVGNEYTVLEDYIKAIHKIKIRHNKCGHEWEVRPNNFLNGSRCPKCSRKKTTKIFKKEVFDLVGDEYILLNEYTKRDKKIKIKHNKCGNIYEVQPIVFLKGSRCPYCAGLKKKTTEEFKKEVFDLVKDEYTVLGEYINTKTKIKLRHNKCGNVYNVQPSNFLQGNRCPKCSKKIGDIKRRKTDKQFKEQVFNLVGDEYTVLGDYKGKRTKIKIIHNKCGNIYEVTSGNFLQGNRCPICKHSKGEEKIAKYLTKFGIKYETQKTFDDLKFNRPLRFDFYLPDKNLLIEYDGKQHFEPATFGGCSKETAEENFKNQQIRDKIKNEYCKENGIKLLRIKYTDFKNIRKILKEKLK